MSTSDVFRSQLQQTIAGLRYWVPSLRHAAEVEEEDALPDYWRLAARPRLRSGCAFELILYETGAFDIVVGNETYEKLPVTDLALFSPLLEAIVDGRVVTRTWVTANTGQLRRVETIVSAPGHDPWLQARDEPRQARVPIEHCTRRDRHYTPFMRAAGPKA